jgi:hypothetical protein
VHWPFYFPSVGGRGRGGESYENCSQSHPQLKVHHLPLASIIPACALGGGVCGGKLSKPVRLKGGSDSGLGEHVCKGERQDTRQWQPA